MTDQRAPTSYGRGVTELDKPTGMYLLDTKEGIAKYMAMSDDQRHVDRILKPYLAKKRAKK